MNSDWTFMWGQDMFQYKSFSEVKDDERAGGGGWGVLGRDKLGSNRCSKLTYHCVKSRIIFSLTCVCVCKCVSKWVHMQTNFNPVLSGEHFNIIP